ncbi:MAG: META domain-containing protein [Actinomycetota bacterium]|nr:META domain-containing protein [Actinomycetota bacterium]
MVRLTAPLLLFALTTAGCGVETSAAGPDRRGADDVVGAWQLVSGTHDGREIPVAADHPITLTVERDTFGGTAACNAYGGPDPQRRSGWRVDELAATEMACAPAVMDSERAYLDALRLTDEANRVGEDELVLTGPTVELRFTAVDATAVADPAGTAGRLFARSGTGRTGRNGRSMVTWRATPVARLAAHPEAGARPELV